MPFGITSAPEETIKRKDMDITPEGLDGTKAIADDILVFDTGSTQEKAEKSHNERLNYSCTRKMSSKGREVKQR